MAGRLEAHHRATWGRAPGHCRPYRQVQPQR